MNHSQLPSKTRSIFPALVQSRHMGHRGGSRAGRSAPDSLEASALHRCQVALFELPGFTESLEQLLEDIGAPREVRAFFSGAPWAIVDQIDGHSRFLAPRDISEAALLLGRLIANAQREDVPMRLDLYLTPDVNADLITHASALSEWLRAPRRGAFPQ